MSDPLLPTVDDLKATFHSFQSEPDWPTNAIHWTRSVEVDPRLENFIRQMRATALTDGGGDIGDRPTVEQGVEEWRLLAEEYGQPHMAYGHANALQNIWNLDVGADSVVQAWVEHRANLVAAREAFLRVSG